MIQIRNYLKKLRESFFFQQSSELLRHLQPDDNNFIEPYEKAFGKFSSQTVKNLHTFIIKYLNRLIHGLVQTSYDRHRQSGYKDNYEKWSYSPNLVTFKVGDLIRCKCSSKQKQILSILNEINRISTKNPQKLKIIRIKNRLRSQTNDILINVKFNNCLIGQIQLAVNTKRSKFAQYSNNFTHYLYQIQRCISGPFSQLANIWKNTDFKSKQFVEIIRSQGRAEVGVKEIKITEKIIGCNFDSSAGHDYINYDLPFRCTYCKYYNSHNDVIISKVHCQKSKTFKCMPCQVESMNPEQLKIKIFGKGYDQIGKNVQIATDQFPKCGCFVQTDSRTPKIAFFKDYKINGTLYYLGKRNSKIYKVVEADQKSIKNFFYHNIVFKLKQQTNQFIKMTKTQVKQSYILPQYVQNIYRSQKQVLFLNQKKIKSGKWSQILSNTKFKESLLNIKKIDIANNNITDLQFITNIFPNIEQINLQRNQGDPLTILTKLKHVNSQTNYLTSITSSINQLKSLQELNIYKNDLKLSPKQLFQIKKIKTLNIKYNPITQLTQQLGNLQNLNQLPLRGNKLKQIPDCIEKLSNLTILNVGKCSLKSLNPKQGSLKKLKLLDLETNQFSQIPSYFANLVSLQNLKIRDNKFTVVPDFISSFFNLVEFTLYSSRIQEITLDFTKLQKLITLNISNNLISRIVKSIARLENLTQFYLHNNKYQNHSILAQLADIQNLSVDIPSKQGSYSCVPKEICYLNNLLTLKLRTTQNILTLAASIKNLNQLQQLDLVQDNVRFDKQRTD